MTRAATLPPARHAGLLLLSLALLGLCAAAAAVPPGMVPLLGTGAGQHGTINITAGQTTSSGFTYSGYIADGFPSNIGTLNSSTLPAGVTVEAIETNNATGAYSLVLHIGISADPGINSLGVINIGSGCEFSPGTATNYDYASGVASWTWSTSCSFTSGQTYPILLTYSGWH